jgi:NitT/TauT family transport system substrate-binding protein
MTDSQQQRQARRKGPTRRSLLTSAAAAGLVGAGILRPRAARAAPKLRVMTYFFAEPSQGGLFQAAATGLYAKHGLDVEVKQGGPQLNGMQLLAGGDIDVFMASGVAVLNSRAHGVPVVAIAAPQQFDLQALIARPDIKSIEDLKGHPILVSAAGRAGYWLWLKQHYGFSDDQIGPYTGNFQPFLHDPTMAVGGIATSEPYRIRTAGVPVDYFLLAKYGYPPYGGPLVAMEPFVAANRDTLARFVEATLEGWKSFMLDPAPGLKFIQETNPQAESGWMDYSVATMKELKVIEGGDAATGGIGIMTEERWGKLAEFMTQVELIKPSLDWKAAFTLDFVKSLHITL